MIPIRSITARSLSVAWRLMADLIRPCEYQAFNELSGLYAPRCLVDGLFLAYSPGEIDGSVIQPIDQKVLVRTAQLLPTINPFAEDRIVSPKPLYLEHQYGVPQSVTIARYSATKAEVTWVGHGLATGKWVKVTGAAPNVYNRTVPITVSGADTFLYDLASDPGLNASGSVLCSEMPTQVWTVQGVAFDPTRQLLIIQARGDSF